MDTESIVLTVCLLGFVLFAFAIIASFFWDGCPINILRFENGDPRKKLASSNVSDIELSTHSNTMMSESSKDKFPKSDSSQSLSKVQPAIPTNNIVNNHNISSSDIETPLPSQNVNSSTYYNNNNISDNDNDDVGLTIDQEV